MKMNTLKIIATLIIGLALVTSVFGTVYPGKISLIKRSEVIVLAKVVKVQNPAAKNRIVTLSIEKVLKPVFNGTTYLSGLKEISIPYERIGKGNMLFESFRKSGTIRIYCLAYRHNASDSITNFHLEMTDGWFGSFESNEPILTLIDSLNPRFVRACE